MSEPTLIPPDKTTFRKFYDDAINELNALRGGILTAPFQSQIATAVFEAGYSALCDTVTGTKMMHTVAADPGSCKTSSAYALLVAATRYADAHPGVPFGAVLLVNEMIKADEAYRLLETFLPNRVGVWTTEHDPACRKREKVLSPAKLFTRQELKYHPLAVVTPDFYLGPNGRHARTVLRDGVTGQRALTICDERPNEAPTTELALSDVSKVLEAALEITDEHSEANEALRALVSFLGPFYTSVIPNNFIRPGKEIGSQELRSKLGWFVTTDAERLAQSANIKDLDKVIEFAQAFVAGYGFGSFSGNLPHFVSYENRCITKVSAGAVLLDGTAMIDNIEKIALGRNQIPTPSVRFDNLEIVVVPQHTNKNLKTYLKFKDHRTAYVSDIIALVMRYVTPDERALVVARKTLLENKDLPRWDDHDERWSKPEIYTEQFGWEMEGRNCCITYWGSGALGRNLWKSATTVILVDEFFIPRRHHIGAAQGYMNKLACAGDLGKMATVNSKAKNVDALAVGDRLRHLKQLALRGNARNIQNGVCGKQRLIIACDQKHFLAHVQTLFPGAKVIVADDPSKYNNTHLARVVQYLANTDADVVTTKDLKEHLGRPFWKVSNRVLTPDGIANIKAVGFEYEKRKGRSGGCFVRKSLTPTEGNSAPTPAIQQAA